MLSALGCGAFNNPPGHIAEIFRDILRGEEFAGQFRHVWFAILDDHNSPSGGNLQPFMDILGAASATPMVLGHGRGSNQPAVACHAEAVLPAIERALIDFGPRVLVDLAVLDFSGESSAENAGALAAKHLRDAHHMEMVQKDAAFKAQEAKVREQCGQADRDRDAEWAADDAAVAEGIRVRAFVSLHLVLLSLGSKLCRLRPVGPKSPQTFIDSNSTG